MAAGGARALVLMLEGPCNSDTALVCAGRALCYLALRGQAEAVVAADSSNAVGPLLLQLLRLFGSEAHAARDLTAALHSLGMARYALQAARTTIEQASPPPPVPMPLDECPASPVRLLLRVPVLPPSSPYPLVSMLPPASPGTPAPLSPFVLAPLLGAASPFTPHGLLVPASQPSPAPLLGPGSSCPPAPLLGTGSPASPAPLPPPAVCPPAPVLPPFTPSMMMET